MRLLRTRIDTVASEGLNGFYSADLSNALNRCAGLHHQQGFVAAYALLWQPIMRSFAGSLQGLTLLLGSMATGLTNCELPYSNDGPCGVLPGVDYSVSADVAGPRNPTRKLRVTVTMPAHPAETLSGQINRALPYPIVFLFNGFLVRHTLSLGDSEIRT